MKPEEEKIEDIGNSHKEPKDEEPGSSTDSFDKTYEEPQNYNESEENKGITSRIAEEQSQLPSNKVRNVSFI